METIGEILRQERERRGLGLQEVFEATRITQPNIEALEQDRFETFPNKVYARAFLRDYANFLDLDSASLLHRYESEWFGGAKTEKPQVQTEKPKRKKSALAWVLGLLAVAVIAVVFYGLQTQPGNDSDSAPYSQPYQVQTPAVQSQPDLGVTEPPEPDAVPVQPAVPEKPSVAVPVQPAVTDTPPNAVPVAPVAPAPPPKPAVPETGTLTVYALQSVWVRVAVDGKIAYQQVLPAGQSKTFTAKKVFSVRSGMLKAVQVKLNGNPVRLSPANKSRVPIGAGTFRVP